MTGLFVTRDEDGDARIWPERPVNNDGLWMEDPTSEDGVESMDVPDCVLDELGIEVKVGQCFRLVAAEFELVKELFEEEENVED